MSRKHKTIAERALEDFKDMIRQSWTYERLTEEERADVEWIFHIIDVGKILAGDYKHCYVQLHISYLAYLYGIGYGREGSRATEWRNGV